jgi:lipopolysaccharide biosynthesis regulator YciM
MKKDDRFALVQILQYRQFSDINSMLENDFFLELIKKDLEEKRLSNKMFDIVLSTYYLTMYLKTVKIEETNKIIDYYNVSFLASSKYGRELAYLISAFYYKNGNSEEAVKLFNLVNSVKNHNLDSEALELLNKQYEHLLNLADNHEYFISNSNSLLNQYSFLAPVINIGKVIEELTYKLPFVPYLCKVLFNLEEQTENNID